jgi:hypothetical protein
MVEEQLGEKFNLRAQRTCSTSPKAFIQAQSFLSPTASPFRPRNLASGKNNENVGTEIKTSKQRLDKCFDNLLVVGLVSRMYSTKDIEKIAELFGTIDNGVWRGNPRLYIVLRRLGLAELQKTFIEDRKITDASFPVAKLELVDLMNGDQQSSFLTMQKYVLAHDSAAMNCENGGHAHSANEDRVLFQQDEFLGLVALPRWKR